MYKSVVFKTLVMITQVGISILVPIFFMLWLGLFIKDKTQIDLTVLFLIIGMVVGMRNAYVLIKPFINDKEENKKSELIAKHKNRCRGEASRARK